MEFSSGLIGFLAALICVPIILILLRQIKSLRHKLDTDNDISELKKEYEKWDKREKFLIMAIVPLLGYLIWEILIFMAYLQSLRLGDSVFLIYNPSIALGLPSLFLAILIASLILHYYYLSQLGSKRYAEYTQYRGQKIGVNPQKLLRNTALLIVPICVFFILMTINSYMKITTNKIVINYFFKIHEKNYSFEDIKDLILVKSFKAPNGNIVRNPYTMIIFSDSDKFNFHRTFHETEISEQRRILSYLSNKANVEITIDDPYPR